MEMSRISKFGRFVVCCQSPFDSHGPYPTSQFVLYVYFLTGFLRDASCIHFYIFTSNSLSLTL